MRAAIYKRQSIFKEDSCSLEVQEEKCIKQCDVMGWTWQVYSDPGYSGKNTERPDFQRMMRDARDGKIDVILVYRLDRISRSLRDFSNLMEELKELGVEFRSITESFDTLTPIGRAMLALIVVFAQLERETTAERVRDNMLGRARMGIWNGGKVPLGFNLEKEEIVVKGKKKHISHLVIDEDTKYQVEQYFEWYLLEDGSVRNNVKLAFQKGLKNSVGQTWNPAIMAKLLRNPIYCIADQDAYDYFAFLGVEIANPREEFDGTRGLMLYNKKKVLGKKTQIRDKSEWILAIGDHVGFIPGWKFVATQRKLDEKKEDSPRLGTGRKGKLAGLLKCGKCMKAMTLYTSGKEYNRHYYACRSNRDIGPEKCAGNRIRAEILESAVENRLKELSVNMDFLEEALTTAAEAAATTCEPLQKEKEGLQKAVESLDEELHNLVVALGRKTLPEKLITARCAEIEKEKSLLNERLQEINIKLDETENVRPNIDLVRDTLVKFREVYDNLDFEAQRSMLRSLIKQIRFDAGKISMDIYFMPNIETEP